MKKKQIMKEKLKAQGFDVSDDKMLEPGGVGNPLDAKKAYDDKVKEIMRKKMMDQGFSMDGDPPSDGKELSPAEQKKKPLMPELKN